MLDIGLSPAQVIFDTENCLRSNRTAHFRCSHFAMALDDSFRWLSTATAQSIERNDRTVGTAFKEGYPLCD